MIVFVRSVILSSGRSLWSSSRVCVLLVVLGATLVSIVVTSPTCCWSILAICSTIMFLEG